MFEEVQNTFMGIVFVYYGSKRFKIGHQFGEHTNDILNLNHKQIHEKGMGNRENSDIRKLFMALE